MKLTVTTGLGLLLVGPAPPAAEPIKSPGTYSAQPGHCASTSSTIARALA